MLRKIIILELKKKKIESEYILSILNNALEEDKDLISEEELKK